MGSGFYPQLRSLLLEHGWFARKGNEWWQSPISESLPESGILEQELNVTVDIVFTVAGHVYFRPVIPTLYQLFDVAKIIVRIMKIREVPIMSSAPCLYTKLTLF